MSAPFQAGDKVVCIRDDWSEWTRARIGPLPVKDGVYCVDGIYPYWDGSRWVPHDYGITLVGVQHQLHPTAKTPYLLCYSAFRRIWTQTTTVTTSIEQPATP